MPLAPSDHQLLLDYFHRYGMGAGAGAGVTDHDHDPNSSNGDSGDAQSSPLQSQSQRSLLHKPNPLALQPSSKPHTVSPAASAVAATAAATAAATGSTPMDIPDSLIDPDPARTVALPPAPPVEAKKQPAVGRMDLFFKAKVNPKRAADDAAAAAKRAKTGETGTAAATGAATGTGAGSGGAGGGAARKVAHKVVFKFNQGFSDAVRRPVTVVEFL